MTNPTTITANPGEQVVDVERIVDAPVQSVFRAYTDPELFKQWCGPRGYDMDLTVFDPRDGGTWAFTHHTPDGGDFGFHGSFHTVQSNERIIQTFEFAGWPNHVNLDTITFEDLGDRTRIRTHTVFQSVEDRDGMVAADMAKGVTEGFEQMDELLAS
jgi:uncharacterized protein YndB with AHSA1/START domain